MNYLKSPIEIKLNRLLILTETGTLLSDLASLRYPGDAFSVKPLISAVLVTLQLTDPTQANSSLRTISLLFLGQEVIDNLLSYS